MYARTREEQADKFFRKINEIADDASGDCVTTGDGKSCRGPELMFDCHSGAYVHTTPTLHRDGFPM